MPVVKQRMRGVGRWLGILWLAGATVAEPRAQVAAPDADLLGFVTAQAGPEFWSVHYQGQKIGWGSHRYAVEIVDGRQVAVSYRRTRAFLEGWQQVDDDRLVFELRGEGALVEADLRRLLDGVERRTVVKAVGATEAIVRVRGDQASERRAPMPRESLRQALRRRDWLRKGDADAAFGEYFATWGEQGDEELAQLRFVSSRAAADGGQTFEVRGRLGDLAYEWHGTAAGAPSLVRLGDDWEYRAGPAATVRKFEDVHLAVFHALGDPTRIETLSLVVEGVDPALVPTSHRQQVERRAPGAAVVRLRRDFRLADAAREEPGDLTGFLESTGFVVCDDAEIRGTAGRVVGNAKDPVAIAERLCAFVRRHVESQYTASYTSGPAVLRRGTGDCKDSTVLFLSLARAAGLPARQVYGLVYVGDEPRPWFGAHVWAEIHDGGQWITVDPSYGTVFVDAAHFALACELYGPPPATLTGLLLDVEAFTRR